MDLLFALRRIDRETLLVVLVTRPDPEGQPDRRKAAMDAITTFVGCASFIRRMRGIHQSSSPRAHSRSAGAGAAT